jgi:hypothetical protein
LRLRTALLMATLAGLTACSSSHPVTLDSKTKQCIDSVTNKIVSSSRCAKPTTTDDTWFYLFLMSNSSTVSVPPQVYNTTPVGKTYASDEDEPGDKVEENDGEITENDGSGDDQDGTSGDNDNDNDGGGSDGDDGGDSGGDDGGGGDD